jgi:hypothetical protein
MNNTQAQEETIPLMSCNTLSYEKNDATTLESSKKSRTMFPAHPGNLIPQKKALDLRKEGRDFIKHICTIYRIAKLIIFK